MSAIRKAIDKVIHRRTFLKMVLHSLQAYLAKKEQFDK